MENTLVSSPSESLTSRSTESMENDGLSVMGGSPPRTSGSRSDTPLNEHPHDNFNSINTDTDKGIVVDAPSIEMANNSAMILGNEEEEDEEEIIATPYQKRKRTSVNYILDDSIYTKPGRGSPADEPRIKRRQGPKVRGVIIGVWRDSDQPDDEEKHVIFGFIDIHDRLRTRIYAMNRRGEELIGNAPTGAGGCWVTFERVIFEPHLRTLSSAQIKEYVKIRSDVKPEATVEERHEAEQKAVLRAVAIAAEDAANPGGKPAVHRKSLGRSGSNREPRESIPRQSLHKAPSFQAVNAADMQTPKASPFTEGKPPGVLLGHWADSDEPRLEDKHAVFGVLSGTDCFRVKVQRVTRDGRYVDGNFPIGAGALWLHYDKVVLDPHLSTLTRPEIKEYCRIRQQDIENRESEKERRNNEIKAVREAKQIVAAQGLNALENNTPNGNRAPSPEMEIRHSVRSEQKLAARQQAEAEAAALRTRQEKAEQRERQNEKSRKEVAAAEQVIQEAAQQELKNNIRKLNKVWVAQQNATLGSHGGSPAPTQGGVMQGGTGGVGIGGQQEETKYHNGIKYERKAGGPFQGKLVSAAQILSIDGEDYVEYRVLTKPSFF